MWGPVTEALTVYVPAPGSRLRQEVIRDGAGVVGSEVGDTGRIRIDFEGNADVFPTFDARVRRAAERHRWTGPDGHQGYPTSACAFVSGDELKPVGSFDPDTHRLAVDDEETLEDWLGVADLGDAALSTE